MPHWRLWQLVLLIILMNLLASGLILLVATQPRGTPLVLEPIATPAPLTVSVVGSVQAPGVYTLPPGSRILHAVEAAGGMTERADVEGINLAGFLRDGQQVFVPSLGIPSTPVSIQERQGLVDINRATLDELMTLPGIGETRANDILTYRTQNGGFTAVEELMNVKGIGQSTFEKLKPYITVVK